MPLRICAIPSTTVGSLSFSGGPSTSSSPTVWIPKTALNPGGSGTSFTVEGWITALLGSGSVNTQDIGIAAGNTGASYVGSATEGSILIDADHVAEGSCWIAGLTLGRLYFGRTNAGGNRTMVGTTDLRGIGRRHFAIEYTADTGYCGIYVNGTRELTSTGVAGSVAWDLTGGSTTDQRIYLCKEKLDATFGAGCTLSELRFSAVLRYNASTYTVPTAAFVDDANTLALYHMAEGSGTSMGDSSGNGATGTLVNSPTWSTADPFGGT